MKRIAVLGLVGAVLLSSGVRASESLKTIVQSYVAIQEHLAADKLQETKAPARAIATDAAQLGAAGSDIVKAANTLHGASDLNAAREAFGTLTDAVMTLGAAEGWKDVGDVRLAFCPMVKRSWLQKEKQIRNPYYGSSMLTCGEFKPLKK
jgi:hypothetical protein